MGQGRDQGEKKAFCFATQLRWTQSSVGHSTGLLVPVVLKTNKASKTRRTKICKSMYKRKTVYRGT